MRILLRYARLLDTTFYMEPCDVLLDEDRISAVLRDRMARQNADLVLDLRGCTIVPGFVDTDLSCRSPEELADRLAQCPQNGVTSVRCDSLPVPVPPDAPAELYVHALVEKEADFTRFRAGTVPAGGVKLSPSLLRESGPKVLGDICRQCEQMGKWVAAQAETLSELKTLSACGITELLDIPAFALPGKLIMYMVAKGICMALSTHTSGHMTRIQLENLRNYAAYGGLICLSSGQGGPCVTGQQLISLLQAGLDLQSAVKCASANGAVILGSALNAGSIRPGYQADLVILQGDPAEDPSVLRKIRYVIQQGRLCQVS